MKCIVVILALFHEVRSSDTALFHEVRSSDTALFH